MPDDFDADFVASITAHTQGLRPTRPPLWVRTLHGESSTGLAPAPRHSEAATRERYRSYRGAIRDSRIATTFTNTTLPCGRARHEWLFRLRFAQGHVAQLDLAPTLAVFASRSVISMPPRSVRDYSAHAKLVIFVETHRLRTADAERDQGVSQKPSLRAIRESRIASSPRGQNY